MYVRVLPSKSTGVNAGRWLAKGFLVTDPSPSSGWTLAAVVGKDQITGIPLRIS